MNRTEKIIGGINVIATNFEPRDDQWAKFVAYVKQRMPKYLPTRIKTVVVSAVDRGYGLEFFIEYTAILSSVGEHIEEEELDEINSEDIGND